MFKRNFLVLLFCCTAIPFFGCEELEAQGKRIFDASIDSVGIMKKDASQEHLGFSLSIPHSIAGRGTATVTGDKITDSSGVAIDYRGFNVNIELDCVHVFRRRDDSSLFEVIVSGKVGPNANFKLPDSVNPNPPDFAILDNERMYGRAQFKIDTSTGDVIQVKRSNWPSETESCSLCDLAGDVPKCSLLPSGFPIIPFSGNLDTLIEEFNTCHAAVAAFQEDGGDFITCDELTKNGKVLNITKLEDGFGLTLDRTLQHGKSSIDIIDM